MGSGKTQAYKMKKPTEFYKCNEDMFTKKQMNYILTELYDLFEFFGYFKKNPKNMLPGEQQRKYALYDRPNIQFSHLDDKKEKPEYMVINEKEIENCVSHGNDPEYFKKFEWMNDKDEIPRY